MTEFEETPHNSETLSGEEKLSHLLWSEDDARVVGEFLKGNNVRAEETKDSWQRIAINTDFDPSELPTLFTVAENLTAEAIVEEGKVEKPTSDYSKEEYDYVVTNRSRVLQSMIESLFRRTKVWDESEYRRPFPQGSFRKEVDKSGFSSDLYDNDALEEMARKTDEDGNKKYSYNAPSLGGPDVRLSIFAPHFEGSKDTSDLRNRKSLAHEIAHQIRAIANSSMWSSHEVSATNSGLKESKYGGFMVGSNFQGSEAVGELFAESVEFQTKTGKEPTIADLQPKLLLELKGKHDSIMKKFEEGKEPLTRYFAARVALSHHLQQLINQGYGNISAVDFIALSTYGYVSFEKHPT